MKTPSDLAPLLEAFFHQRLISQRQASPHTVAAYRDTFHLFLQFAQEHLGRSPVSLTLADLSAPFVVTFLDHLETTRHCCARSRNLRLAALRTFFRFAVLEAPQHAGLIQRVLAIPNKRYVHPVIDFLTREEMTAVLAGPDRTTWIGRRDHALLLTVMQTGLRLSELTALARQDVTLGSGAHVRCVGKGRKQRCTPLSQPTARVLRAWLQDDPARQTALLFPNARGGRLSADAVQRLVAHYATRAQKICPSLQKKRVSPHVLRHTAAMELLQAGVDCSLIAIWLGHESVETTQHYLHADLALKEIFLTKTQPVASKAGRYRPGDRLLRFLKSL
jgi:site-specific recombinase XerD